MIASDALWSSASPRPGGMFIAGNRYLSSNR
jgi:hypothetical protein